MHGRMQASQTRVEGDEVMNQKLMAAIVVLLMSVSFATVLSSDTSTEDWIVVLNPDVPRAAFASAYGAQVLFEYSSVFNGLAMSIPIGRTTAIAQDSRVLIMQRDGPVEAFWQFDQDNSTGWDRIEVDKSTLARIDNVDERVDADIAILDTGLDMDVFNTGRYIDLNVVRPGKRCIGNDGGPGGGSANDDQGHGSHVGGIAGAIDNRRGVVGVAPGARLHPVKVLNDGGSGQFSWIICGIDWVTGNASLIDVVNLSLGGAGSDDGNCGLTNNDAVHLAICKSVEKGVVYVVSAGNNQKDAATVIPAAYDEVITVAALTDFDGTVGNNKWERTCWGVDFDDRAAYYTNWGQDLDLIAPGTCILSTYKSGIAMWLSGTSMAAPHVSGVAAMHIARDGKPTTKDGVMALRQTLIDEGFPWDGPLGYRQNADGFYNQSRAIHVPVVNGNVSALPPPPPPPQPKACSDGIDNDGDGLIDGADPGCDGPGDDDEYNPPPPVPTVQCADLLDNDADGFVDYPQDLGCVDVLDNDEDPTTRFIRPYDGQTLRGRYTIMITATDSNCDLRSIQFYVDGRRISGMTFSARCSYTWTYRWNTRDHSDGSHELMAMATDLTNGVGIHRISITVKN